MKNLDLFSITVSHQNIDSCIELTAYYYSLHPNTLHYVQIRVESGGGTRIWKVSTMKKLGATTCGKELGVRRLGALNGIK